MKHARELVSIPLSDLVACPRNVRRQPVTGIEELAALIESQGLLQNLVVTEQVVRGRKGRVRFAVAAGERRRRALLLLQQRGRLPKTHEVPCELVPSERALEVSVAENSAREAMHPADEFEAFSTLIAEGKGIEDVAARFGISTLTVQRRLKLANVSPKLLALYRQDGINLDQLMALTLCDEHALQERTWEEAPWDRSPAALRRRLTAADIAITGNALVRFVGVEDYEAAGGHVRRDLFDGAQAGYVTDAELLRRLAQEKLATLGEQLQDEGWAWVEARVELDGPALRQFSRCESALREATPEEHAVLDELQLRETELDAELQALRESQTWSPDDGERIDLEEQDIAARRAAIQDARRTWEAEAKARAGVIVTVARDGDAEIIRGLVREADRKALAASRARLQRAACVSAESAVAAHTASRTRKSEHSEPLERRLSAHRTAALQVVLSRTPTVALAALTHPFVLRVFGGERGVGQTALQVTPSLPAQAMLAAADDLKGSRAWQAFYAGKTAWLARLPKHTSEWLAWLIGLPQIELIDLLTLCAAATLNAMVSHDARQEVDAIAEAVGLDMADWWEPTAEGYLSHVPKAQIAKALKEAGPDIVDDGIGDMKKEVLVVEAASRLAGKRWLPVSLRPRKVA